MKPAGLPLTAFSKLIHGNKKPRPPGKCQKGRGTSRVTTLLHRQLTLPASVNKLPAVPDFPERMPTAASLFQPDNGCCAPAQPTENHKGFVRCAAPGCIRSASPARLSSAGCFLCGTSDCYLFPSMPGIYV